jgi:hypothetical protein
MRLTAQTRRLPAPAPLAPRGAPHGLPDPIQGHGLSDPLQRKTVINNVGQTYNYGSGTTTVGKSMEAWLDPDDVPRGWSANLNSSQDAMMSAIREYWGIEGGDVVKGHLLNDNLGGTALGENLYPITRGANKDHLSFAENAVKTHVWTKQNGMYYSVNVYGTPNIYENVAYFDCVFKEWDTAKPGDKSGKAVTPSVTVFSNLESARSTGMVWGFGHKSTPSRHKAPKKPKGFEGPKTKVSELSDDEVDMRDEDF